MHTTLYALRKEPFESDYLHLSSMISRRHWESLLARVENHSEVAELLAEWRDDLIQPGDTVFLSGRAAVVLFETCRARCQVAAFEVNDSDFLFADLAAAPPVMDALSTPAQVAWDALINAVDVAGTYRSTLPSWLDHAARFRCVYTGLLTPAAAGGISECRSEIQDWLAQSWRSAAMFQEDINGLLDLVATSVRECCWVLGWEPGT